MPFHSDSQSPGLSRWLALGFAAMTLSIAACSKSEPARTASSAPAPAPAGATPDPAPSIPHKIVDYMAGMKDIKDFAAPKPAPADAAKAPAAATPAPAAAKGPEVKTASAPATAAAPVAAPAPAPAPPAAKAPADNVVAKAAPTAAPVPAPVTTASPITREAPDFPREAVKAGIDGGTVRARMSIDGGGNVTGVQIVESRPARIFDRAVRETLGHWKFNAGTDNRSYETEVEFRR